MLDDPEADRWRVAALEDLIHRERNRFNPVTSWAWAAVTLHEGGRDLAETIADLKESLLAYAAARATSGGPAS